MRTDDAGLTEALTKAAREIHEAQGTQEVLDAIVRTACYTLPGIDHVGVSVAKKDGTIETLAATDDLVLALDAIQHEEGEGPCVYAMEADTVTVIENARHEQRWPRFTRRAVSLGLRAAMGLRLHVDDSELAALNMYSTESESLEVGLADYAELFASYAALALGRARREDQLTEALITRRVIGQATGIVMERYGVDESRAFGYLTRVSNTSNRKLREVAQQVVDDGNDAARGTP